MASEQPNSHSVVEGAAFRPPVWSSWLLIGFGLFVVANGLGVIGFVLWLRISHSPASTSLFPLFGLGWLLLFLAPWLGGVGVWRLLRSPRWVIGADRLQFVVGTSGVRLEIFYENITAVEVVRGSVWGPRPYIGLRLADSKRLGKWLSAFPNLKQGRGASLGFDWVIFDVESNAPLEVVHELLTQRLWEWRSGRPELLGLERNARPEVTEPPDRISPDPH